MLFFGKENVFMCLVVFQKIFRKIFSSVWKMLQGKRQNQKNKHSTQIDACDRLASTAIDGAKCGSQSARRWDRDQRRDLAKRRSRSREAPRWSRSARRRVRNLWSRSTALVLVNGANWSLDVRTALTGSLSPSCALALSLSLSLRNSFEVKIGMEIHFRSQSLFFWVNGNQFPENSIFRTNQTPAFPEKHFRKWFSPKTNTA